MAHYKQEPCARRFPTRHSAPEHTNTTVYDYQHQQHQQYQQYQLPPAFISPTNQPTPKCTEPQGAAMALRLPHANTAWPCLTLHSIAIIAQLLSPRKIHWALGPGKEVAASWPCHESVTRVGLRVFCLDTLKFWSIIPSIAHEMWAKLVLSWSQSFHLCLLLEWKCTACRDVKSNPWVVSPHSKSKVKEDCKVSLGNGKSTNRTWNQNEAWLPKHCVEIRWKQSTKSA